MLDCASASVTHSKSDSKVPANDMTLPSLPELLMYAPTTLIFMYLSLFISFNFFTFLLPGVKGQAVAQLEEEQASFRPEPV